MAVPAHRQASLAPIYAALLLLVSLSLLGFAVALTPADGPSRAQRAGDGQSVSAAGSTRDARTSRAPAPGPQRLRSM